MVGNFLWSPDTCFQVNRHIGSLFGEKLDTLFTSSDSKISEFTRPHVIGFVAELFFSTLERAGIYFPDSLSNSPNECGRWPYPKRKSCGFENIRIRVDMALVSLFGL